MASIDTRAGAIHYDEGGEGPPLVLLHANGFDRTSYDAVVPRLAETYRTIRLDWPGMGESPAPAQPREMSAALLVDVLADAIAALRLDRALVIGNSVGGFAGARLAARQPARVRGLVLVNSGGFTPRTLATRSFCWLKGREWVARRFETAFIRRIVRARNEHTAALLAQVARDSRSPTAAAINAAIWRSFTRPESQLADDARAIRCPTLLAWGRRDWVIPLANGEAANAAIAGSRLVTFDTGHCPFAEAPDAFLADVLPFLASCP